MPTSLDHQIARIHAQLSTLDNDLLKYLFVADHLWSKRQMQPDVVLVRLSPCALMTLQGACPQMRLVTKPQCQIVPLANVDEIVVGPGCAVSCAQTNLPAGELTCAFHGTALPEIVERLERSAAADHAVAAYAVANDRQHFVALQ